MRVACVVMVFMVASCASDRLALTPPSGVDFTGHWQLNEADSDDPQRLVLSQLSGPAAAGKSGSQGGQGGQGGGRGGRGSRGGGAGASPGGSSAPPPPPAVGALAEGLGWPGKQLDIKQVAGVVAMTSGKVSRILQPAVANARRPNKKPPDEGPRDRDMHARTRGDGPPARCGWDGKTLVVQSGDPDDDHPPFEQRYGLSEDGTRLVEVIGFTGGRSAGFTMSRVWDRVP